MEGLDYVKVFLDDTGVLGKATFEEHISEVDEVLTRMKEARLKLNLANYKWAMKEAKYLGFIAKEKGFVPDLKKIEGLLNMRELKNKKQVRGYLGGVIFTANFERND